MAQGGKNAKISSYINNVEGNTPVNWQNLKVVAFFDNKGVQADITTTSWEFAGAEAKQILDYRDTNGRFQGIPYRLKASNDNLNLTAFDGFIDPTDGFVNTFDDDQKIQVNIKKRDGLNNLNDKLSTTYLDYLEHINIFTANDYTVTNYVVQKKVNLFEELVAAIMIYQMVKELKEIIKDTAKIIAEIAGFFTAGAPFPIASIVYAIVTAIIQTAYLVAIAVAVIKLTKQLVDTFIPPQREHRCLKLRTGLEKISSYLGYTFHSNISELDTYHYLPSNPQLEKPTLIDFLTDNVGVKKGIPNTVDYGNNAADFFGLASNLFNARTAVVGNDLFFYTDDDPFWLKQSTWSLPSARPRPIGDNSGDLKGSRLFSFATDLNDRYTVDEYKGTSYQIITDVITVNDPKAKCIKGSEEIDFNVCLPTRKNTLTGLEKAVYAVKQSVLDVFNVLSGNPPVNITTSVVSSLIQSDNWHSKPKILVLNNENALPLNHRDLLSAKFLYHKYHESDSFVANNFYGQKETYSVPSIGFGLEDFNELSNNSYFDDESGANGKMVQIDWGIGIDSASLNYWIRNVYDTNLKETFIEPEN
jgi:hypothetical protein